jgi:membrane protease YdiL (CAAX protease family)
MRTIGRYVVLAYLLSWASWLLLDGRHTHIPGLFGPALAAALTAAYAGRSRLRALAVGVLHWRIGAWWLVALSPLAFLAIGLLVDRPAPADLWRINGLPAWGPVGVLVLLVLGALGEETGWRGYLQPALQHRMRPLVAMLVVALVWAGWHAPLFAMLDGYRGFNPVTLAGFVIGLASGAIVLGWLYNRTGSVLAVAVWHATYNLTSASLAARGLIAALTTTAVIIAAAALVVADIRTGGRTLAPVAHISRRTAWTPGTSPRTRGRSTPTVPSAPR